MLGSFLSTLLTHFCRRPRFWLLVCLLLVLGGVAGAMWWLQEPIPEPDPLPEAGDHLVAKLLAETREQILKEPRSSRAWGEMGMALWANDFTDQAVSHFEAAEKLDPSEVRWPYFQGLILVDREPSKGLSKLRRACELDVRSITPRLRLAEALFAQGKLEEAAPLLEAILAEQPNHAPALLLAARVDLGRDQLPKAEKRLSAATQNPLTARAAFELLSQVLSRQGHKAQAARALAEAESYPDNKAIPDPYW